MRYIPLTTGGATVVDDEDYEKLIVYKWCCSERYIHTTVRPHTRLHDMIMGVPPVGFFWDHRNRIRSDNRRANFRLATNNQNQRNKNRYRNNTSGFKGVSWYQDRSRWFMKIGIGKEHNLRKSFETAVEAALAYDKAAKKYHGEFAVLNFPDGIVRFPRE